MSFKSIVVFFIIFCHVLVIKSAYINQISLEQNAEYSNVINNTIEYIFFFNITDTQTPSRIEVISENATKKFPILIVVRQQTQVLSWQLPLLVDYTNGELEFNNTSRTLCPDQMMPTDSIIIKPASLSVSLSCSSPENVQFQLKLVPEIEFNIVQSEKYETVVSPSAPKIFYYNFPENNDTMNSSDTVLIKVDSEDEVCMYVSVQNYTCPIYDLEHDIRFEGFWETISSKGGLIVPKSKFPRGFFLILVSKSDDYSCFNENRFVSRQKNVKFVVLPGVTKRRYLLAVMATLITAVSIYLITWLFLYIFSRRTQRIPFRIDVLDRISVNNEQVLTPNSENNQFDDEILNCSENSSISETDYDTITEAVSVRDFYRSKSVLYVCDLARKPTKLLQKKSYLYLWHCLTVSLFYGLPVIQLVITYQKTLVTTGNLDLCYYNFLCAHPLTFLSDFNHVFSNLGYVVLGVLFILLVIRREKWHNQDVEFEKQFGIPQHHGLFYSMGVALIMEGILSASYHLCPNHTNFQFDTSFMYVMSVLIMIKLYQNRHPDINATAYSTFAVLAAAIFVGMVGILLPSIYFWVLFTILHLVSCFLLTINIYYLGCWKLDAGIFMRIYRTLQTDFSSGSVNILRPVYKGRMCLLLLGNACNWGLAVLGLMHHDRDFATYLLAIFMSNTLLYTLFYITMKILHKERIMCHAVLFILLATLFWGASGYFFIHKSISWALTPAESRTFNQDCKLLNFYDSHDIWHFLSSFAMFFSFMILLTLDDDLTHTHRSKIHVF